MTVEEMGRLVGGQYQLTVPESRGYFFLTPAGFPPGVSMTLCHLTAPSPAVFLNTQIILDYQQIIQSFPQNKVKLQYRAGELLCAGAGSPRLLGTGTDIYLDLAVQTPLGTVSQSPHRSSPRTHPANNRRALRG